MHAIGPTHSAYVFFFHPLENNHSIQFLAVITTVALTILTGGLYLIFFAMIRSIEDRKVEKIYRMTSPSKLEHLIEKQKNHLAKLQKLAEAGHWQHLQTHTSHPDSGFDWWMFPIKRPSTGYGNKYAVSSADVDQLKKNEEFMKSYRQGVILVAKSWGWDLETGQDITSATQKWTGYQVRLGKMLDSLLLFGQNDLHKQLVHFIDQHNLRFSLDDWIQKLIPFL